MRRLTKVMIPAAAVGLIAGCGGGDNTAIDAVDPPQGSQLGGQEVLITGEGIGGNDVVVTFGDSAATEILVVSSGQLRVITPPGPAAGAVAVRVANAQGFAELAGGFTYNPTPTVTALNPSAGPRQGGTAVTITGTGFSDLDPGATAVRFDGELASDVTIASDTQITATTPRGAPLRASDVEVANDNGVAILASAFIYEANGLFAVNADSTECRGAPAIGVRVPGLYFFDLDELDLTFIGGGGFGFHQLTRDGAGGLVGIEACTNDLHQIDPSTGESTLLASVDVDFSAGLRHLRGGFVRGADGQYLIRDPNNRAQLASLNPANGQITVIGGTMVNFTRGAFFRVADQTFSYSRVTVDAALVSGLQEIDTATGNPIGNGVAIAVGGSLRFRGAVMHRGELFVGENETIIVEGNPRNTRLARVDPATGVTTFIAFIPFYLHDFASGDL